MAQSAVVLDVMQHAGIGTGGNDRCVGGVLAAMTAELVEQFGFEFVFVFSGRGKLHRPTMRTSRNIGGPFHQVHFVDILDQTHLIQRGANVANVGRWTLACPCLCANGIQRNHDTNIPGGIVAH